MGSKLLVAPQVRQSRRSVQRVAALLALVLERVSSSGAGGQDGSASAAQLPNVAPTSAITSVTPGMAARPVRQRSNPTAALVTAPESRPSLMPGSAKAIERELLLARVEPNRFGFLAALGDLPQASPLQKNDLGGA